jgi:pimeloyl-ACP methyl ester carboxylesterase
VHVQIAGPSEGEDLFFLRSLGTNLHVRDARAESLSSYFRAVHPDLRGHVLTSVPTAPYSIDETGETRSPCWTGGASAKLIRRMRACAIGSKLDWPQSMRIMKHEPPVAPQHAPLCRGRQVLDMSKFLARETHDLALTKPFIAEEGAWH